MQFYIIWASIQTRRQQKRNGRSGIVYAGRPPANLTLVKPGIIPEYVL